MCRQLAVLNEETAMHSHHLKLRIFRRSHTSVDAMSTGRYDLIMFASHPRHLFQPTVRPSTTRPPSYSLVAASPSTSSLVVSSTELRDSAGGYPLPQHRALMGHASDSDSRPLDRTCMQFIHSHSCKIAQGKKGRRRLVTLKAFPQLGRTSNCLLRERAGWARAAIARRRSRRAEPTAGQPPRTGSEPTHYSSAPLTQESVGGNSIQAFGFKLERDTLNHGASSSNTGLTSRKAIS
ncbi:hypothetical protein C8Q70DRAFT_718177 [Cubamyces menziesii]|nr:hypothetical protein C8Q70DRAFT_718177 [Cubamyces menziesii]